MEECMNKNDWFIEKNDVVNIYLSEEENSAVKIAAHNLVRDMELVFGCNAMITSDIKKCNIVIGTVDITSTISICGDEGLVIDRLRKEDGTFLWEGFLIQVVDKVLYIIGSNRRGTVYGIYDLCEEMGVSPWYYWADVPVKKKDKYLLAHNYIKVDWPSIPYRGIFINDEEELDAWSKLHTWDGTIGPTTYTNLYELILRLKGNYIWPAMHVNCFNENPENGALADKMGVVVGTSHCDMLLRSNQNEWKPWISHKGYKDAVYDYSMEGKNRDILKEYWHESVEKNKDYEVCYTMGMRGIHDSGFITKEIDDNILLTREEKFKAKVELLEEVIKDQKEILQTVLGKDRESKALKNFIPYKEVLSLYDAGFELPEDITLIWANDNFGYMRRYPGELERNRIGGNGLYYHVSYWAHPGTGMSYLFIGSTPLAHMANELKKSYESGIRKVWVLNIGGLKPLEQEMEFFIRYGWDIGKESSHCHDTYEYTKQWMNKNFSGNCGDEVGNIYEIFAQVTNVKKVEHMKSNAFSQENYGDEAGRRLLQLQDIFDRGNVILKRLPKEEQEAFFQLILMKIHASYYTNHEFYYADRSVLSYNSGNMQAADVYTEFSVRMLNYKRRMLHYYNHKMSSGKWNKILTPESFPPPPTAMYPTRKPALSIKGSGMKVTLWNKEDSLTFMVYGKRHKWIELGNQGEGCIPYKITISNGVDWIMLSNTEGVLTTEKRILVTILEPKKHVGKKGLITICDMRNNVLSEINILVKEDVIVPDNFVGYIEGDGYISIPSEGYIKNTFVHDEVQGISNGWIPIKGMGRYEGSAMMASISNYTALEEKIINNPYLEYQFYAIEEGEFLLEIYRFLTLSAKGRIRLGVSIDDNEPIIVESTIRDEWIGNWQECIMDNGEKLMVNLPLLTKGVHQLKIYMIDNYVTFSKLVIYTKEKQWVNLGPPTSYHTNQSIVEYGHESPMVAWEDVEELCNEFYDTKAEEVMAVNVMYADKEYFKKQSAFTVNLQFSQATLGEKRYETLWKCGGEKDIIKEFGQGIFLEENGIVAIEAEYALENSKYAYLTTSKDNGYIWSHLQAETNGRTGFAMHVEDGDLLWEEPKNAPGMHYHIKVNHNGIYQLWMLIRHHNSKSDSSYISIDGDIQPLSKQFKNGNMHTYSTSQVYYWCYYQEVELTEGEHLLSILARKSQLRVDRIYLTLGDELPPADAFWKDSKRKSH